MSTRSSFELVAEQSFVEKTTESCVPKPQGTSVSETRFSGTTVIDKPKQLYKEATQGFQSKETTMAPTKATCKQFPRIIMVKPCEPTTDIQLPRETPPPMASKPPKILITTNKPSEPNVNESNSHPRGTNHTLDSENKDILDETFATKMTPVDETTEIETIILEDDLLVKRHLLQNPVDTAIEASPKCTENTERLQPIKQTTAIHVDKPKKPRHKRLRGPRADILRAQQNIFIDAVKPSKHTKTKSRKVSQVNKRPNDKDLPKTVEMSPVDTKQAKKIKQRVGNVARQIRDFFRKRVFCCFNDV